MNNLNKYISLILFVLINALYLCKYLYRISEYSMVYSLFYIIFLIVIYILLNNFHNTLRDKRYLYYILSSVFLIQIIFIINIPVEKLNIDRWSVITSFLDSLFNGDFPYLAKSHLGNPPGPFPGYYLFALPFYLLGEIGLFSFTGLFLFFFFLKFENLNNKTIFTIFICLGLSIVVWYELITRSTIFVNMAIVLLYFSILSKLKYQNIKTLILLGLLGGLVLSTRGIVLYIFIAFYTNIFIIEKEWKKLIVVSLFTFIGFVLTLLPFLIWDWELFLTYNPITLQANFIPKFYLLIFAIIAILIGRFSNNNFELIRNIGILLFIIVSIPFFTKVINSSIYIAIVENGFDISYYIFSIPFLAFTMQNSIKKLSSNSN